MTRQEAIKLAQAAVQAKAPTLERRFWSKVHRLSDDVCWLWTAAVRRKDEGYGAFYLNGRHQPAHKVAWMLTNKREVPAGMVVCHSCDIPGCCNPSHLWIGTPQQNDADRVAKGRQCRGSKQKYAKLTESQVLCVRLLDQMFGLKEASRLMGLDYFYAWGVSRNRRAWRHV